MTAVGAAVRRALIDRVALFDGLPLATLPAAYVATAEEEREAAEAAEAIVEAIEALARRYLDDAEVRRLLRFPPALDRLIREVDPGYARAAPIARIDGFMTGAGGRPRFVAIEANTDGTAGFHDHDSVDEAVLEAAGLDLGGLRRAGPADGKDVRERAAEAILECGREARGGETPSVAVVDWREEKTVYEFRAMAARFVARGVPARFCDVRDLVMDGGRLVGGRGGDPVTLVYRRVIGMDLCARPREAATLFEAYRTGAATFVGSLRSEVGWTKAALAVLSDPRRNAFLPAGLRRRLEGRIAETRVLDRETTEAARRDRGAWVIKPFWGNGARGVVVGRLVSDAAWREALDACLASPAGHVIQRHVEPEVRSFDGVGDLFINVSPFVLGGRYAGLYVRGATAPVIHLSGGAFTLCALVRGEPREIGAERSGGADCPSTRS